MKLKHIPELSVPLSFYSLYVRGCCLLRLSDLFQTRIRVCTLFSLMALSVAIQMNAQIAERVRPAEWDQLVQGARFIDRFLPMPAGQLSEDTWGGENVRPRYVDNGIEDETRSYWGGNILAGTDGMYHLYVCGWPENAPKGHHTWPSSTVYHTVSDNLTGPFVIKDTIGPGHNPEAFRTKDGQYVVYVIDGYYLSDHLDGPWNYQKFDFDRRDRNIIEGLTNLTFAGREDGSFLMVCRGGGVWVSQTGLSSYNQITDKRVYPPVKGEFEDPVVWRDHIQYHLIVNDWLGRIAFYLRSKDGLNWVTDPGEAYMPGIAFHEDGRKEDWFKYERIKIFQDTYGRAIQANFAVIDTLKDEDKPNDRHSSKNIGIPLNPGLLISMPDTEPITPKTKTIRVRIAAESGFNPQTDVDVESLRFGASTEVNYGRGCRVLKTEPAGTDLIVTFDATGHGITPEEFAPKLIGKNKQDKMLYGYTRLPWVDYNEAILSTRKPIFNPETGSFSIEVQNFGQRPSAEAKIEITYLENNKPVPVGKISVPALQSYESKTVDFKPFNKIVKSKEYSWIITIYSDKRSYKEHFAGS